MVKSTKLSAQDQDDVIFFQMTKRWQISITFDAQQDTIALVCPCGAPSPTEQDGLDVLTCDECGRAITFEHAQRMILSASDLLTELYSAFESNENEES